MEYPIIETHYDSIENMRKSIAKAVREANEEEQQYIMAVTGNVFPNLSNPNNFQYEHND